jgi:glycosyltransferase involved in cell wall biosynthesis
MDNSKVKFVFLTPAYNCKQEMKQTLLSMFAQSYDNWRAIIIDDVSVDGTGDYVKDFSNQCGFGGKIDVVRREEKYGEVRNTVTEVENNIDDNEIVIRLDGGDWLTDNDCLSMLNQIYCENDPAVCWTDHRWAFTDFNISGKIDLNKYSSIYTHPWVSSHLKTFKASDLKAVNRANFFDDEGNWIMIACDQAVFLPMMHLAIMNGRKLIYIPRVCYHYNIDLEKPDLFTEDRSIRQKHSAEWIRQRGYVR